MCSVALVFCGIIAALTGVGLVVVGGALGISLHPSSMPKRGRRDGGDHDNNPLSSARKGGVNGRSNSSGVSSNNIGKADREARALWLRKSGAGFRLFLSYYGSQPLGVITTDDDL